MNVEMLINVIHENVICDTYLKTKFSDKYVQRFKVARGGDGDGEGPCNIEEDSL